MPGQSPDSQRTRAPEYPGEGAPETCRPPAQDDGTSPLFDYRRQLEAVCNNATVALFIMDERQQCVYLNPAAEKLTGYTLAEVRGRALHDVIHHTRPDGRPYPLSECPIDRALPQNNQEQGEEVFVHKDGHFYQVAFTASPIREQNRVIGTVIEVRDVTEARRAEAERRRLADQRQLALDAAHLGWWHYDPRTRVANWDRRYQEIFGVTSFERPNEEILARLHPDDLPQVWAAVEAALDPINPIPYSVEYRVNRSDGTMRWVEAHGLATFTGEGEARHATSFVGTVADITERKGVEQAFRESGEFTRSVLDNLFAFVGVLELDGTLIQANQAPLAAAGIALEDVYGKKFWDCYWWSYAEPVQEQLRAACARAARGEAVRFDVAVRLAGDTRATIDFQLAPLRDASGRITHLIPSAVDITDRVRAETAMRDSEEKLRALADHIPQLAWMADEHGSLIWYNRRWFDYTGTTYTEMSGWGWQAVHHPEYVDLVTEKFRQHVAEGRVWEDTFPLRRKDGVYRWFLSRAVPIRDANDQVIRWFGTNTDITELREAEEALRAASRRKDEFLAMLAHELRNPLAPILNSLAILRTCGPTDLRLQRQRDTIERQVEHMSRLVADLLDVSRISRGRLPLERAPIDLIGVVRLCVEDYREALESSGLRLELQLPPGPLWIEADQVRLCQGLGNLLSNALKFTPRGGRLYVEVTSEAGWGAVLVRDSGEGIPPELLPEIWESFHQGKQDLARTRGGLGLGLALVKSIVEMHGGTVAAHSAGVGQGAEFRLTLPLTAPPTAAQVSATVLGTSARASTAGEGPRRVLVIEDNLDAAETLGELLELQGYEARLARTGPAGVEAARDWLPDIVLCDIGLPGLDGYAVASMLRGDPLTAGMRLIAISGYAQPENIQQGLSAGFDEYLAKPVTPDKLLNLLATK